jgi:hypothetical protein
MLRQSSAERNFLNHFTPLSARQFDKLSASSGPVEGLRESLSAPLIRLPGEPMEQIIFFQTV